MELFQRVRQLSTEVAKSQTKLAQKLDLSQPTFNGYLNETRQNNLWPLLPKILELFPQVRREWLYFGEEPMLKTDIDADHPLKTPAMAASPDDALGRIAALTGINTHDALQLQLIFGVDYSEIRPWLSRYLAARQALAEWRDQGAHESDIPEPPAPIPDAWLHHFWLHYGPNPGWIQFGQHEHSASAPMLMPSPLNAELERLRAQLVAAEHNAHELREQLGMKHGEETPRRIAARMPGIAPGDG
ncbi:MAG: hypothetical protein AB7U63_10945 [Porticoccaceae bacterium]